jgi:hypothetical protein
LDKNELKKKRFIYLLLIITLVISAYLIPYVFLSGANTFFGAFFYWSVFSLLVIYITIKITSYWRE